MPECFKTDFFFKICREVSVKSLGLQRAMTVSDILSVTLFWAAVRCVVGVDLSPKYH